MKIVRLWRNAFIFNNLLKKEMKYHLIKIKYFRVAFTVVKRYKHNNVWIKKLQPYTLHYITYENLGQDESTKN